MQKTTCQSGYHRTGDERRTEEYQKSNVSREEEQAKGVMLGLVREQMRTETRHNDVTVLNVAIENFKINDLREMNGDLSAAKDKVRLLKLRQRLISATSGNDREALKSVVGDVESSRFSYEMQYDLSQARRRLQTLERVDRLSHGVLQMKPATSLEFRNYAHPPAAVKHVMQAVLLLMGEDENKTKDWIYCQKTCSKPKLHIRVLKFDIKNVHPEIAARVIDILSEYTQAEMSGVSAGAGTFYIWANGVSEEVMKTAENGDSVEPADEARQREIFAEQRPKERKQKKKTNKLF